MLAGRLKNMVRFERRTEVQNETGEIVAEWTPVATVWADVSPINGREILASNALHTQTTHRVRVRYWPGIETAHRINLGNERYLNIQSSINASESNFDLEILAMEGRGDFGDMGVAGG